MSNHKNAALNSNLSSSEFIAMFGFDPRAEDQVNVTKLVEFQGQKYVVERFQYAGTKDIGYYIWEAHTPDIQLPSDTDRRSRKAGTHTRVYQLLSNDYLQITYFHSKYWGDVTERNFIINYSIPDHPAIQHWGTKDKFSDDSFRNHNIAIAYQILTQHFPETRPEHGLLIKRKYGNFAIHTMYPQHQQGECIVLDGQLYASSPIYDTLPELPAAQG